MVEVREVEARSILNRSGIPGVDWAVNPYVGCQHACVYCYASFMKRFTGHAAPWGRFVDVKVNAPALLAHRLRRPLPPGSQVLLSSVTDPYQPAERHYAVTRRCLEALAAAGACVSILTKSDLVVRDLDIIASGREWDAGFTVTTLDAAWAAAFEPGAPPPRRRLAAAAAAARRGVKTWAFFGPVLPGVSDGPAAVAEMFSALAACGVREVLVDRLNPYPGPWARVCALLAGKPREVRAAFEDARRDPAAYGDVLAAVVGEAAERCGLSLRLAFDAASSRPGGR